MSMGISGSNRWRYVNVPFFRPYVLGIFPYIGLNDGGLMDPYGRYLQSIGS